MNYKALFRWLYEQIHNYNLFMLEETDYIDDDEEEETDPASVLKQQKYTTWLYILLLIVSFYILLYTALMKPEQRTITEFDVTPVVFEQLYRDHVETLSCPCSTITVPLKLFVSNTIKHHPVCESIFISKEWIEALHFENASRYGTGDFRTTASSQFKILASLCSLSQDIVSQNLLDLDNSEFINNYLLSQDQVHDKVNGTIEFFKNGASNRIISFLNYLRTTTRADYLISALNTNYLVAFDYSKWTYLLISGETAYSDKFSDASSNEEPIGCSSKNPMSTVGFLEISQSKLYRDRLRWSRPTLNATLVSGFFTACTPLEAILQSTLDCLYNVTCLQFLTKYFPAMNQVCMKLTDQFLYGGLTIILRLIAPFLINIWLKCHLRNRNVFHVPNMIHIRKLGQYLKRLNLFKKSDQRAENNIKQQRISTRVYLILLFGSFLTLLLFTSLSTGMVPTTEPKPSLTTYKDLQDKYSKTLKCPCSNVTIPHHKFVSLLPVLHQVCTSDFVTEKWLSLLKDIKTRHNSVDWRNRAFSQFHLLSDLCELANKTINDAIRRFLLQSFIVSNVLSEADFANQLNVTLEQFFQSTTHYFDLFIKTVQILMQVDQPYPGQNGVNSMVAENENPIGIFTGEPGSEWEVQIIFQLTGPRNMAPISTTCICATDIHCQSLTGIYDVRLDTVQSVDYISSYNVPGSIAGFNRLKVIMKKLMIYLYNALTNLNIFLIRNFGSNIDRMKAKRLGQWATRLYLVLFAVGLAILALHTIIRPQEFTKTFNKPSLNSSKQLFQKHKDKLKCLCSSIASPYKRFMNIEARFHEICSSPFASKEGRLDLTVDLVANLSKYFQKDYRRFLSAHLQYLEGLCQLSNQTVNIFIQQFHTSLFTAAELLPETNFHERLDATLNQSKLNVPTSLTHLFFLIRMLNDGNAFISTYGTNFQYISSWAQLFNVYAPTKTMIYDNNCSCGLYSNCTTQATFIIRNPSELMPITGLKIGCTPSESFRASTLECFYDDLCINLIKNYTINANRTNSTNLFKPLSTINSSFPINISIAELINNLFIEDWNIKINYSAYFEQCLPLSCSYTYIQRFNVLHIITTLLGLQGGLAIVLKWICPKIIRIIVKIYQYRKKRKNVVQPVFSIETTPIEKIRNSVSTLESIPTNGAFQ
ncbi:unnamed protein product [Adineta steineri]|uniref:Uncharacterized protein n=1 Tax=Adineta steineri TaxID=433720 RepID=A0A818S3G0_9BILA|nr:unnamed protein product [Adineta steineri]